MSKQYKEQFALLIFDIKKKESISDLVKKVNTYLPADLNKVYSVSKIVNAEIFKEVASTLSALEMLKFIRAKLNAIEMDESLLKRSLNDGFSGGEKKRNEILQMTLLEPKLAILDETDSGLDIDALRIVAEGVNQLRSPERSFIVVTHYQRLLNHIIPDFVHVLSNGKILATGDRTLAEKLEVEGYDWIKEEVAVGA